MEERAYSRGKSQIANYFVSTAQQPVRPENWAENYHENTRLKSFGVCAVI
jgi:hypothetical protein